MVESCEAAALSEEVGTGNITSHKTRRTKNSCKRTLLSLLAVLSPVVSVFAPFLASIYPRTKGPAAFEGNGSLAIDFHGDLSKPVIPVDVIFGMAFS